MRNKGKKLSKRRIAAIVVAFVIALTCIALIVLNCYIPLKYLSAYLVIGEKREKGVLTVTYLDVGYGDCTVIELPDGKVMLIDGGDGTYAHQLKVLKYLNRRSIESIDFLVCSSVNAEHCGGLAEILQYKKVGTAYVPYCNNTYITDEYRRFTVALKNGGVKTVYSGCGEGYENTEYGYFFTFLSPTDYRSPQSEYAELNASGSYESILGASAVVWLEYAGTSFVFTSDASASTLKRIAEEYETYKATGQAFCSVGESSVTLESCDILTVAGHGSDACTYVGWYEATMPEAAVVSVGENNMGCPSLTAMTDIANFVAEPLLTSVSGNVAVRVTRDGYSFL